MDLLCFLFCHVFAMSLCASVCVCFVVTCWEGAGLLALFVVFSCEFVTFPLVSTPYLCNLTYSVAAEVFQVGSHIYP